MKKAGFRAAFVKKRYPKKLVALILLLYGGGALYGQETLNASGGFATIGGQTYGYSIGEMVRARTVATPSLVVTEGILQPLPSGEIGIDNPLALRGEIQVYPNPASDVVMIQPNLVQGGALDCRLLDLHGREVVQEVFSLENGNELQQINIGSLAVGTYMLRLSLNRNGKQFVKIFKLQKLQ